MVDIRVCQPDWKAEKLYRTSLSDEEHPLYTQGSIFLNRDFYSISTSTIFSFKIEERQFQAHSALMSAHSKPLDRMMNGPMQESEQGFATIEDRSDATFARFKGGLYGKNDASQEPLLGTRGRQPKDRDASSGSLLQWAGRNGKTPSQN